MRSAFASTGHCSIKRPLEPLNWLSSTALPPVLLHCLSFFAVFARVVSEHDGAQLILCLRIREQETTSVLT